MGKKVEKWVCDACRVPNEMTVSLCEICQAPKPQYPRLHLIYSDGRCHPEERSFNPRYDSPDEELWHNLGKRTAPKPFEGRDEDDNS